MLEQIHGKAVSGNQTVELRRSGFRVGTKGERLIQLLGGSSNQLEALSATSGHAPEDQQWSLPDLFPALD